MVQIVNFKDLPWSEREERHREGSLAFKNLFRGQEGDPNNFRLVLSRSDGDYTSPHHRHNFDQVRFCVRGSANIAPGKTLNDGDVGYFPEGTRYGPQKDIASERLTLVLQCGGASGLGYMSSAQLRRGLEELEKRGIFAGGRFRFHGQTETESRELLRSDLGARLRPADGISAATLRRSDPDADTVLLLGRGRWTERHRPQASRRIHRARHAARDAARRRGPYGFAWRA